MSSHMTKQVDLIVVGAGSGGIAAARRAASHGATVVLMEGSRIGGTCVLRGCVPKKLMMYASGFAHSMEEAAGFGWNELSGTFDLARWSSAKAAELTRLEAIYRTMLAESRVHVVTGRAELAGEGMVRVGGDTWRAPRILIATGGAPDQTALPGLRHAMTSDDVLDLQQLPASLLVIGAGYVGVEFASILRGLGVQVTLAYRSELPLRGFDQELRSLAADAMARRGIHIVPQARLIALEKNPDGYVLTRADGDPLRAGSVLNATGRRPQTADLGLESSNVRTDAAGAIVVDEDGRTSAPGIWAIGDVTNRINLTPVAIAEGRAFADSHFGGRPVRADRRRVASAVFCDPPLASVGLTEEQARTQGPVDVYTSHFRPMKTAFIHGEQRTFMKLLVDGRDERVLGAHMLGPDAPEIVQALAVAISAGASKHDFDRTMALHPTAAEEFVLMREPARRHREA